jgi:hypothetical protein
VILGDSERQVAEKFGEAAKTYANNPVALHLRAMNMLYEGLKENSTIVIVPSSAVETMQLGGLAGLTALTRAWVKKEFPSRPSTKPTVRDEFEHSCVRDIGGKPFPTSAEQERALGFGLSSTAVISPDREHPLYPLRQAGHCHIKRPPTRC